MAVDNLKDAQSGALSSHTSGVDFEALVRLSNEAIVQVDLDGRPMFISSAAERFFGWSTDKLSQSLSDLIYVGTPNSDVATLQAILSGRAEIDTQLPHTEVQIRSAFGPVVWAEATAHRLLDDSGAPRAYALYFRDIAKRKELEGLLESANQTDPLTGLVNRRAFEDSLKREWSIALREQTHTTLIKVSLDRFDALTEEYGPSAADDCLTKVARTLKETARRPADVTARTAGSEFAILLPRTHEMGAETISAYIQVAIQDLGIPNKNNKAGGGIMTASVGTACAVAENNGITESSEFIVSAAENCVFEARREGGNRVKSVVNFLGR
ncbi:MAG: diguanylate cyclase [Roseibium sp.]